MEREPITGVWGQHGPGAKPLVSLILGLGFGVRLSDEDIAKIECLRVVAIATNFRNKIAIN